MSKERVPLKLENIEKVKRYGKAQNAGFDMAEAIIEFCHLMYQKDTATRVICAVRNRLNERSEEFER